MAKNHNKQTLNNQISFGYLFIINKLKSSKKIRSWVLKIRQIISTTKFRIKHLIPKRIRKILSYIIRLKWLMKPVIVKNVKYSDKKPLVSIITPFYNQGETIKETIESVLCQTFQNFEYIIVNDGSDEKNTKILHEIKNKKIKIIEHPKNLGNGSPAAARNTGIKAASGKYIICLDSDDILDTTYIEKLVIAVETDKGVSVATTNLKLFGVENGDYDFGSFRPSRQLKQNYISTASIFPKKAWEEVGGYTEGIGYEDWEFWIKLAEKGYWGKNIHENLLGYRTVKSSRYREDVKKHYDNKRKLRELHPNYTKNISRIFCERYFHPQKIDLKSLFINLNNPESYKKVNRGPNILMVIPWMTFGGAETLIHNYTKEIKNNFNVSFVTILKGENEWQYKFKEVTDAIYHLPNLFSDRDAYIEFILNYIRTRKIDILHGVHIGYDWNIFQYLPRIKKEFPDLKIVFTFFNDNVPLFETAVNCENYVDKYIADNQKVVNRYLEKMPITKTKVIPNGVDSTVKFNPLSYDRDKIREELGVLKNEVAVFFVGRISEEKKPDVFLEVAKLCCKNKDTNDIRFFMIGDGPMRTQIESDFDKISNFTYLGYQSEIPKYLSAADIFVLPSRIEGFPLSILEAMSMEVAVVASRVGAVPDILIDGQDGFVVSPSSITEIYEAVVKLNKERDILDKMKKKGRIEVGEKYSNIILGRNYTNLYKEELK